MTRAAPSPRLRPRRANTIFSQWRGDPIPGTTRRRGSWNQIGSFNLTSGPTRPRAPVTRPRLTRGPKPANGSRHSRRLHSAWTTRPRSGRTPVTEPVLLEGCPRPHGRLRRDATGPAISQAGSHLRGDCGSARGCCCRSRCGYRARRWSEVQSASCASGEERSFDIHRASCRGHHNHRYSTPSQRADRLHSALQWA